MRSAEVLFGVFSRKDQFCETGGLVYVRFQSTLDVLVVAVIVAGVIGELLGFLLGVGFGLV
jgi:hypothetical protein